MISFYFLIVFEYFGREMFITFIFLFHLHVQDPSSECVGVAQLLLGTYFCFTE